MNVSARTLSATVLAFAVALPFASLAGDGPGCDKKAALTQDVEGNAQLTAASHRAGASKRFEMMDADKDGQITATEIDASRGAEGIAWASREIAPTEKIRTLDSNADGALSAKEYAEGSQRVFDSLDVDGDGVLSAAEMHIPSQVTAR